MIRLTALRVTLHLRSGSKLRFVADSIVTKFGSEITGITVTHSPDWPHWIRLADIEAITTRRVVFPRWLS